MMYVYMENAIFMQKGKTMAKKKVAVLFGGVSADHNASLKTAYSVLNGIPKDIYEPMPIGITRAGRWLFYPGAYENILDGSWETDSDCCSCILSPDALHKGVVKILPDGSSSISRVDAIFPVLHGKYGEDGRIQGLCRMTGLPVIGNDMSSANITQDRKLTNIVLKDAGFDVADYMTLSRDEIDDIESAMEKVMKSFSFPLYVAATSCSSSIGAYRAENKEQLCEAIKTAFSHHPVIIIENELKGRIIECAIITRERAEDYIELGELVPDADTDSSEFVAATYDFVIPAALDSDMAQKVKEVAKSAFKVLSCRCYARIDLLLCEDKIYVRRVRGVPGLEDNNIFTRLMTNSSFEYSEMLDYLISSAIDKR